MNHLDIIKQSLLQKHNTVCFLPSELKYIIDSIIFKYQVNDSLLSKVTIYKDFYKDLLTTKINNHDIINNLIDNIERLYNIEMTSEDVSKITNGTYLLRYGRTYFENITINSDGYQVWITPL